MKTQKFVTDITHNSHCSHLLHVFSRSPHLYDAKDPHPPRINTRENGDDQDNPKGLNRPEDGKFVWIKGELKEDGRYGYVFRRYKLGELGRILFLPHEGGQMHLSCEVTGDADDPMTEKRREILGPIAKGVLVDMAKICGDGTGKPQPYINSRIKCADMGDWNRNRKHC